MNGTISQELLHEYAVDPVWFTCVKQLGSFWLFLVSARFATPRELSGVVRDGRALLGIFATAMTTIVLLQVSYMNAIKWTNSGTATVLQSLNLLFVLAYVCVTSRRVPRRREVVGVALAFAGVWLLATGGDHALGGFNFDGKMSELIQQKLVEQGIELDDEDDALFAEIREKAEKAKLQLSSVQSTRPVFTINGKTCRIEITREEFEAATADLMQRTKILLEEVMADKNISWAEIDELLVVGGSTRMPMVKRMLEELSGKSITYKIDPDTAVAQGAAIFASTFDLNAAEGAPKNDARAGGEADWVTNKITISDVTSQSLGVITLDYDTRREQNTIIIPHNSKIPTTRSVEVYTVDDNQTRLRVRVTEGDETDVEFVKVIGSSTLSIPPYPKGSPVEIIYAYDPDQTVFIEVIDKVTNQSLGTFQVDRASNLTADQVARATGVVGRANVE